MTKKIIIKRCVRSLDGTYYEKTEEVELVKTRKRSILVRLESGDIIKRKLKDIVKNDESRIKTKDTKKNEKA